MLQKRNFIAIKNIPPYKKNVAMRLGYPDSNQERQDQNLQCYHYTISQYVLQLVPLLRVQRYELFL